MARLPGECSLQFPDDWRHLQPGALFLPSQRCLSLEAPLRPATPCPQYRYGRHRRHRRLRPPRPQGTTRLTMPPRIVDMLRPPQGTISGRRPPSPRKPPADGFKLRAMETTTKGTRTRLPRRITAQVPRVCVRVRAYSVPP